MTPREKAIEIYDKFYGIPLYIKTIKQCCNIVIDEITKSEPTHPSDVDWDDCGGTHQHYYEAQREEATKYWEQVKLEIEKI